MKNFLFILLLALVTPACSIAQRFIPSPVVVTATPLPTPSATWTPEGWTPGPTPTSTITVTPEFACPNAPEMQLKLGDMARVTFTDGPSVRLRRDPVVVDDNIIKLLGEGTKLEIIGGPECAVVPETGAAMVFWQIRIPGNPLTGWVAEGDAQNYYIEPLPE